MLLTPGNLLSVMEWFFEAGNGWKLKLEFSRMYENLQEFLACFLG
jgi:hypothetical protein